MSNGTASKYLRGLGPVMLAMAQEAKTDAAETGDDYQRGRQMGLYEAVNLLAQQPMRSA